MRCKNCQLFKNSRDLLFVKFSTDQWRYIVNFVHDLFNVSIYSVLRYCDLKPISQEVKDKNLVFLSKKESENYLSKYNNNNNNNNNNNDNNKIKYIINNRRRYFLKINLCIFPPFLRKCPKVLINSCLIQLRICYFLSNVCMNKLLK